MEYNPAKLQELILYIASRSDRDPSFSTAKLAGILFYSDFTAYRELGAPITGASYLRLEYGPYPDGFENLKRVLQVGGDIAAVESQLPFKQERTSPEREPRKELISVEELRVVDRVLEELWTLTASEVRTKSLDEPGCRLTKPSEVIPYSTAILSKEPPTAGDIARGQELAAELGLLA